MINKIDLEQVKVPSYLRLDGLADEINKNLETLATAIQSVDANGVVTVPGPQGDKGEQGIQGLRGEQGPAGVDGKDGLPGKDGVDGKDGRDGVNGAMGLPGLPGKDGVDGKPGKDGVNGANGKDGIQGPAGADGVGIKTAIINTTTGNLILTKTDGTTVDVGKVANAAPTTTAGGPPVVGSAPNPFAPIVVTSPPGYKAANLDDGVELTLDTLAVTLNTAAPRSLLMRVTTGTMSVRISGEIYWCPGNYTGNYGANYWSGDTLTTTNQQIFGWNFPWEGDKATYHVIDRTNRRLYRITLIIGGGYKKNFIVMERLV